jgi:phosphoribosylaminoimidazolecarboxamide formyltransferase/IMP cyclohydrolase
LTREKTEPRSQEEPRAGGSQPRAGGSRSPDTRLRLGVLASGGGTNLQAIIDASERRQIDAVVSVVISDRKAAGALERARRHGIEAVWVDPKAFDSREAHDEHIVGLLRRHKVDLVILAGYMRLFTRALLDAFPWRVMNIHPALLPAFPGKDGLTPALAYGVKISGCTVHFVDLGTDSGPIILQAAVPVREGDTPETLAERIHAQEHRVYPQAIQLFAEGRLKVVDGRRVEILSPARAEAPATAPSRRRRALVSVHDKTGLIEFARGLAEAGFDLISSGGTARAISEAGLPVIPVEHVTGFPEMLGGRVKTLHPVVHGGILARRDLPEHLEQIERQGIDPIDLVAVNLYPFQATVNKHMERGGAPGEGPTGVDPAEFAEAVENIDIGGPTLIRSAAKNHNAVIVVTDPAQYGTVLDHLRASGDVPLPIRRELAMAAFQHTAFYDAVIASYLEDVVPAAPEPHSGALPGHSAAPAALPDRLVLPYQKALDLRYGENPHQAAAFYRHPLDRVLVGLGATLPRATQLQGKELSYNNIADAEAALRCVEEFAAYPAAAVAVKHMNPCGAAVAGDILTAYRLTYDSDPVSIFGGIVALTRPVEAELAEEMVKIFLEVIMAPAFAPGALTVFSRKPSIRLLGLPVGAPGGGAFELKSVAGGLLVQAPDAIRVPPQEWKPATRRHPTAAELQDLLFAWKVCRHVKSNAVTVAKGGQILGVGAGQMNRVDSTRLAVGNAGERARGAVLASDAFFPFPDSIEVAAAAGVTAVVQPGGSLKDDDVIAACDKADLAMVLTGERHFRH